MKEEIRKRERGKRDSIHLRKVMSASTSIRERLVALEEFQNAQSIGFYVSVGKEVFTHAMIKMALALNKQVLIPCVEEDTISFSEIASLDDLVQDMHGIPVPVVKNQAIAEAGEIDLFVVPGIAFTEKGYRIGYGRGMYDRFLAQVPEAGKIGLCYEENITNFAPSQHDVPMNLIVTEDRIIRR